MKLNASVYKLDSQVMILAVWCRFKPYLGVTYNHHHRRRRVVIMAGEMRTFFDRKIPGFVSTSLFKSLEFLRQEFVL